MAAEQIKSASITTIDATPQQQVPAGQGQSGRRVTVDDYAVCSATPLASTKSFYRLIRFPAGAVIKSFSIATDRALDSGTPTLAFDFNVAWASSAQPNYCPVQFQLASLSLAATEAVIPTTAFDGVTTTTIAAYSAPNLLFGTYAPASNSAKLAPTNLTFNGSQTANSGALNLKLLTQQPLWQTLGFVDGRGNPADPGGFFDIIAYVSTAANVGVAGALYAELNYVI